MAKVTIGVADVISMGSTTYESIKPSVFIEFDDTEEDENEQVQRLLQLHKEVATELFDAHYHIKADLSERRKKLVQQGGGQIKRRARH